MDRPLRTDTYCQLMDGVASYHDGEDSQLAGRKAFKTIQEMRTAVSLHTHSWEGCHKTRDIEILPSHKTRDIEILPSHPTSALVMETCIECTYHEACAQMTCIVLVMKHVLHKWHVLYLSWSMNCTNDMYCTCHEACTAQMTCIVLVMKHVLHSWKFNCLLLEALRDSLWQTLNPLLYWPSFPPVLTLNLLLYWIGYSSWCSAVLHCI